MITNSVASSALKNVKTLLRIISRWCDSFAAYRIVRPEITRSSTSAEVRPEGGVTKELSAWVNSLLSTRIKISRRCRIEYSGA